MDGIGGAGVGAGLPVQVAQAVHRVSGAEVPGIGNAGDLSQVVVGRVDLAQGAADDVGMRFELADRLVQGVVLDLADAAERVGDLGQVAVGVVFIGGDGRCLEAGADRLFLAQGDGAGGRGAGAGAEPAALKVEPESFGLRPHFSYNSFCLSARVANHDRN